MSSTNPRGLPIILWVVQAVLCALYLYTGWSKLAMTPAVLHGGGSPFFPFIGLCEFLGAIGLILPSLLRIATRLTPIAAAGLAIIMLGAIRALALGGQMSLLWLPIAALIGDIFVIYGRTRLAPIDGK
ncbi:MAG: DoxX family protein [Acidobacteria bacterium]|nr:MAG: DoxX family protein [Acidobacteriota bacterium]